MFKRFESEPIQLNVPTLERVRLGIDLDGVVANFTKGWMDLYNREHQTRLTFDDSQGWHDMLTLTHFDTMGEFWRWAEHHDGRTLFWHLEPFPGAVDVLRELDNNGHTIVVVTSRPAMSSNDTHDWVKRHGLPAAELHMREDKWLVDCDVYLDDGPHLLPDLVRHRPDDTVCRYVRPWNVPVEGAIDIEDWDEFRDLISRLSPNEAM